MNKTSISSSVSILQRAKNKSFFKHFCISVRVEQLDDTSNCCCSFRIKLEIFFVIFGSSIIKELRLLLRIEKNLHLDFRVLRLDSIALGVIEYLFIFLKSYFLEWDHG